MVENITFDFNFDYVIVLLFTSYVLYGYISGGHKQIRLSINLILPFVLIYYLSRYITVYLYVPFLNSFMYEVISELFDSFKYTLSMVMVYIFTYLMLFLFIFIVSHYAKKYLLNENMRAKLGKKNSYIGAVFAVINGYVLIYFIILPVFSLNVVGSEAVVTNFILKNPPPFSRVARTAEKAVPVKSIADKATAFQTLLGTDGIEGYYNEAIYQYQQLYIGGENSKEKDFMDAVYPNLTDGSKSFLNQEYAAFMSNLFPLSEDDFSLSMTSYPGVSRVLVEEYEPGVLVYEQMLVLEQEYTDEIETNKATVKDYENEIAQYEINLENYQYQLLLEAHQLEIEAYNIALSSHLLTKIEAIKNNQTYSDFDLEFPVFDEEKPENYEPISTDVPPSLTEVPEDVEIAQLFLDEAKDRVDASKEIKNYGTEFTNIKGLLLFFVDYMELDLATDVSGGDIDNAINNFKINYNSIRENINDDEIKVNIDLAMTSIRSYDVFNAWLTCTDENIANESLTLEDLNKEEYRCSNFDINEPRTYDFTQEALALTKSVFDGENLSWYILQYKYDYENGAFVDEFEGFDDVLEILKGMKELSDEYDERYKDIADSIDGNLSMVFKVGISVTKYNMDVYDTLENTPLLAAMFNDLARICSQPARSAINTSVEVCSKTEQEESIVNELFNLQYLTSEIVFKAYIMVDEENQEKTYDVEEMNQLLAKISNSVDKNVIAQDVISEMGDQFAFNVIDENTNLTLLEEMYLQGRISIEAMRVLASDEFDLFSEEFEYQVKSLIR